ncbi:MAG TPA: cysteine desulfurase family protein [Bacteroidia bacterium]|nr:cysteine desulfurase family protein [Bacteroidia bacterium]
MKIYLDNAATTPIDPEVVKAMIPVLQNQFGNPSSIHSYGREVRSAIEQARKSVARFLNVSPAEIFFTSGGTEANNTAIFCSVRDLAVKHVISSAIEHHAVLHTLQELEKEGKIKLSLVKLDDKGRIDLSDLENLLKSDLKTMVSLMHANNEIGNLIPLKQVAELCVKYNAVFHSDTVQTMGHYPLDLQEIPVHFITCAAHKFHGPKGIGFLYINHGIKIHPFIHGGAQERNMRGGTENVYGIVGLAKALEIASEHLNEHMMYIQGLKSYMIDRLKKEIPGIEFNGDPEGDSLYTVLNASFPPSESSEMLLFNLDINGIACSGGSACSSGSNTGSHVLRAIYGDVDRPSVRFSFSKYNTKEEIDLVLEKLKELYAVKVS